MMTDSDERRKRNKDALLESYNLSREQRKRLGMPKKDPKKNSTIKKVNRIDL